MTSYEAGKEQAVSWIKYHLPSGSTCLDVGAGNGRWADLLGQWVCADAVEIYEPYIVWYGLKNKYRNVFRSNITDFTYNRYDLIIFGDVIEHLTVQDAQNVIEYASTRCKFMIVTVPFQYKQDAVNGNQYERHIQDDLTPEIFAERYPGFTMLCQPVDNYAYYFKAGMLNNEQEGK